MLGVGGLQLLHQAGAAGVGLQHGVEQGDRGGGVLLFDGADARVAGHGDVAVALAQVAQDDLEQGGLARPVAADQPDFGAVGQADAGVVEEATPPGVVDEIVDAKHDWKTAGLEVDRPGASSARDWAWREGRR